MSDFLHNLRNGNVNNRYDRTRKNYDNPQYRNSDRHNRDKRNNYQRKPHTADQLAGIKKLLEDFGETQKELVAAAKARIEVESRMADALEGILAHLGKTEAAPRETTDEIRETTDEIRETTDEIRETTDEIRETPDQIRETIHETEPAPVQEPPPPARSAEPAVVVDPKQKTLAIIQEMREQGVTYEKIARHLADTGVPTVSGRGKWRGQAVSKLLAEA